MAKGIDVSKHNGTIDWQKYRKMKKSVSAITKQSTRPKQFKISFRQRSSWETQKQHVYCVLHYSYDTSQYVLKQALAENPTTSCKPQLN